MRCSSFAARKEGLRMTKLEIVTSRRTLRLATAIGLAASLCLSACGDDSGDQGTTQHDAGTSARDGAVRDGAVGDGSARDGSADASGDGATRDGSADGGAVVLDDAQSAHVLTTINTGEIDLAMIAVTRATRADVRSFAMTMITEHTDAQTMIDDWASANGTVPVDNEISRGVMADAMAVRAQLEAATGTTFDAMYVQSQVTMHKDALTIIDMNLLPGARDAQFRALLTSIRASVARHLAIAMALQATPT
jgi:putative membrane protein